MDRKLRDRANVIDALPEKFPTVDNCSDTTPHEMAWPAFVNLPGVTDAAFMMPAPYWALVSWHLHDFGLRRVCDSCGHKPEAAVKLLQSRGGDPNMWTGAGIWVPADTPEPDVSALEAAVDALSPGDRAQFFQELARRQKET